VTRRTSRILLGALLGVAGLWLSLRDIPAATLREALLSARWGWVAAALAVSLIAVLAVVLRWGILLQPATVSSSVLGRATLVGQMLNIVLPFRLGEVARVYTAMGHSSIGVARLTASLAIEKALDLAIFGVTAAVLVTSALLPRSSLAEGRWLLLPATTALALAAMWLVVRWRVLPRIASAVAARGGRVGKWTAHVVTDVSNGLDAWRSAGHAGSVLAWTVLIFVLAAAGNQLMLRAFDLRLPVSAGFAILVVLQAGSVPPSLPGRLGIYNYLTVLTLGLYGVGRTEAATYSIALYFVAYVPKVVLGALVAADPSWRPSMSWTPNA
jgi:glycosyltransferase 2 family protein